MEFKVACFMPIDLVGGDFRRRARSLYVGTGSGVFFGLPPFHLVARLTEKDSRPPLALLLLALVQSNYPVPVFKIETCRRSVTNWFVAAGVRRRK